MSGILGPNGLPVRPSRQIPDEVIIHHLGDHDARLNALAAQSVHLGIMVEYLVQELGNALPDFDLDAEEFAAFRDKRFAEMKQEAQQIDQARTAAAAERARNEADVADLDLDEIDDVGEIGDDG